MTPIAIYALRDPRDGRIRYVGKSLHPRQRLNVHVYHAKCGDRKSHLYTWLRGLLANGRRPEQIILEWSTEKTWQESERKWIRRFDDLCNLSDGGEKTVGFTGGTHSEEFKARQRVRMSGNGNPMRGVPSPARGKSPWIRGRNHTPATRAKMREAAAHRPPISELTRHKLSMAKAGERHHAARLTWSDIETIRCLAGVGLSATELGKRFGICRQQASRIINMQRWKGNKEA